MVSQAEKYLNLLRAPRTLTRIVGLDVTQDNSGYFYQGDYSSKEVALKRAKDYNDARVNPDIDAIFFVYDDQGRLLSYEDQ